MRSLVLATLCVSGLVAFRPVAGEPKPLTPVEAIKKVNQEAIVQMRVKATKNALEHRGEIFLDSEENFRDEKNLGVVVTKDGAAKFKLAGVDDPAVHFRDKIIQVIGKVIIKEERPRIEVDDPKQIQIVAQTQPVGSLVVVNETGTMTTFSAEAFAKLPRKTVKAMDHSGVLATYDGVPLVEILRSAKTTLGKDLKGAFVANCVLVEAADNYRVVFSLVEIDPDLTDTVVLVADHKDGSPLNDQEGPFRLVVPSDKRHMRWVRQVTKISVRPVGEIGATKKEK
jgi:uncharacterized surface protein with fasciclin (FAS1) repeats